MIYAVVGNVKLRDLSDGQKFRFVGMSDTVYVARGHGWYSSVTGYDGGPWHSPNDLVVLVKE